MRAAQDGAAKRQWQRAATASTSCLTLGCRRLVMEWGWSRSVIQRWSPLGGNLEATVQAAEGQVFKLRTL